MTMQLNPLYVCTLAGMLTIGFTVAASGQATGEKQTEKAKATAPAPAQPETQPSRDDTKAGATTPSRREAGQPSRAQQRQPSTDQQSTPDAAANQRDTSGERARTQADTRLRLKAENNQLFVGDLRDDSFFARAGLRSGDRIVSVDGRTFTAEREFNDFLANRGGRVPIVVMRDGREQTIHVDLQDQGDAADDSGKGALGIWFYGHDRGAQIVDVVADSPAHHIGLRAGDWVVKFNGAHCGGNWEDFVSNVKQVQPGKTAQLEVFRNGEMQAMDAQLGDRQEIFADAPAPQIASSMAPGFAGGFGQGMERRAFRPDLDMMGQMEQLERRIEQLEREIATLRGRQGEQAPAERRDRREGGAERGEADRGAPPPPPGESAEPKSGKSPDRKTPRSEQ